MPKLRIIDPDFVDQGIEIEYHRDSKELEISGWFDNVNEISPSCVPLGDFCVKLGITKKDLPPWSE